MPCLTCCSITVGEDVAHLVLTHSISVPLRLCAFALKSEIRSASGARAQSTLVRALRSSGTLGSMGSGAAQNEVTSLAVEVCERKRDELRRRKEEQPELTKLPDLGDGAPR